MLRGILPHSVEHATRNQFEIYTVLTLVDNSKMNLYIMSVQKIKRQETTYGRILLLLLLFLCRL